MFSKSSSYVDVLIESTHMGTGIFSNGAIRAMGDVIKYMEKSNLNNLF